MNIINKRLTPEEFKAYCENFNFSPNNPNKIVVHHTWRPTVEQWQGQKSINGLKTFYENKKPTPWSAGPHLFCAPDGIWLFTPMNLQGIHASAGNYRSIGIEVVGDYDEVVWEGEVKKNALSAIDVLMDRLKVGPANLKFHNDYSTKTCPGKAIKKDWIISELAKLGETQEVVPEWGKADWEKWKNTNPPLFSEQSEFHDTMSKGEFGVFASRLEAYFDKKYQSK